MKVGLLGLGVVGGGTWAVLTRNVEEIARRAGQHIEITHVAVRDSARARVKLGGAASITISTDPYQVVRDTTLDIIIELIGGDTLARELVLEAIAHGKHVVTANKALLAKHGNEIFEKASAQGVMVAFEAAVAGGIPIIKAIREGLTANRIEYVAGIINGTTNFMLSAMHRSGQSFAEILTQAQHLGYAELDPSFDIEGIDAAHKLTLLASLAFGIPVQFERAYVEGIAALAQADIAYAMRLGYRIKLLGITRRRPDGIELRVHPALVPAEQLLASVDGPMNAILVQGDAVGPTLYYGQGAGAEPTASSVIADLIDITRLHSAAPGNRVPPLAFQANAMSDVPILPIEKVCTSYYLRLQVRDQPGVLADIAGILAEHQISIDSMIQQPAPVGGAEMVFVTHQALEGNVNQAMIQIEALPCVSPSMTTRIRIENLS